MSKVKCMTCTCCGNGCHGRQWWNQDRGYTLCSECVKYCIGPIEKGHESQTYGKEGVHFFNNYEESRGGFEW